MNRENLSRHNPDETWMEQNPDFEREQNNSIQHYEVLMEYGDCLVNVGKYDDAQKHYEKAATLSPDAAGPYVGLGVVALQKNLPDDAEIAFRVACRLGTGRPPSPTCPVERDVARPSAPAAIPSATSARIAASSSPRAARS